MSVDSFLQIYPPPNGYTQTQLIIIRRIKIFICPDKHTVLQLLREGLDVLPREVRDLSSWAAPENRIRKGYTNNKKRKEDIVINMYANMNTS